MNRKVIGLRGIDEKEWKQFVTHVERKMGRRNGRGEFGKGNVSYVALELNKLLRYYNTHDGEIPSEK